MNNYDVTLGYTRDNIQLVLDGEKWFTVRDPAEYDRLGIMQSVQFENRVGIKVDGEIVGSVLPVAVIPISVVDVVGSDWLGKRSPYTSIDSLCSVLEKHYGKTYGVDSPVDLIFHRYAEPVNTPKRKGLKE